MTDTAANSLVRVTIKGPLRCEGPGRLQWGEDPTSAARVAVRFLPLSANGETAVRSLARLPRHSTLPKVLQIGTAASEAFAVLDFPQGRLLDSTLERPLELRRVLRMGHDLADALAAAHAEGIAHGELSAQSVLLLGNDDALLWDLPLVFIDRLTDRRGEGRILRKLEWTAEFLSPERAAGLPASAAADVWALAALMCRTAGSPRPSAASTLGVVHMISTGAWAPRISDRLPPRIKALLQGMLASDPAARLTATQVKSELAALLLEATTLQDLPAVQVEALSIPSTGEDGDLVEMLRPDPPRSAVPDAHAIPTISEDGYELEEGVDEVKPVVPWTDPGIRIPVDPELHTVVKPLPKEHTELPTRTDPNALAFAMPEREALPEPVSAAAQQSAPVDAAPPSMPMPPPMPSAQPVVAAEVMPAPADDANTAPSSEAPRMAGLDRVVSMSTATFTGETELPPAALPRDPMRTVAIAAAIALPLIAIVIAIVVFTWPSNPAPKVAPGIAPGVEAKSVPAALAPKRVAPLRMEAAPEAPVRVVSPEPPEPPTVMVPAPKPAAPAIVKTSPAKSVRAPKIAKASTVREPRKPRVASNVSAPVAAKSAPKATASTTSAASPQKKGSDDMPKPAELKSELKRLSF